MNGEIEHAGDGYGGGVGANAIASGGTLRRMQTAYATAITVQKPRDMRTVESACLKSAELLGDLAFYAWGQGKDRIEGPSFDLAMEIARNFGNCAIEAGDILDLPDAWIIPAAFIDIETGFTYSRPFRQSKRWQVSGKHHEERKSDMRFQIGASKSARNVVLRSVPAWLVDRCLDAAKGGTRKRIEAFIKNNGGGDVGLALAQKTAIDKLARFNVSEGDILRVFDRRAASALTVEDLVLLAGNIRALETRQETPDTLFPPEERSAAAGAGEPRETANPFGDGPAGGKPSNDGNREAGAAGAADRGKTGGEAAALAGGSAGPAGGHSGAPGAGAVAGTAGAVAGTADGSGPLFAGGSDDVPVSEAERNSIVAKIRKAGRTAADAGEFLRTKFGEAASLSKLTRAQAVSLKLWLGSNA